MKQPAYTIIDYVQCCRLLHRRIACSHCNKFLFKKKLYLLNIILDDDRIVGKRIWLLIFLPDEIGQTGSGRKPVKVSVGQAKHT